MIKQLRIDERLIHGQIATQWSKALDVDMICVANDAVAANAIAKSALMMACPPGRKANIRGVDETIRLLQDPRAEKLKIMLIVDNPADAYKCATQLKCPEIDCANYAKKWSTTEGRHHFGPGHYYVKDEDLEWTRKLCAIEGSHVFSQLIPAEKPEDVAPRLPK